MHILNQLPEQDFGNRPPNVLRVSNPSASSPESVTGPGSISVGAGELSPCSPTTGAPPHTAELLAELLPHFSKVIVGIDNGFTGAIARIGPQGEIACRPVIVTNLGQERLLDVDANLALLRELVVSTGQPRESALVVFEQVRVVREFGARNNYTNGRNNEFWRVVLTLAKVPFTWVNPRVWQQSVFRGIRGTDTKVMADLVRRQRFPGLDMRQYNRSQREGINDALCILLDMPDEEQHAFEKQFRELHKKVKRKSHTTLENVEAIWNPVKSNVSNAVVIAAPVTCDIYPKRDLVVKNFAERALNATNADQALVILVDCELEHWPYSGMYLLDKNDREQPVA